MRTRVPRLGEILEQRGELSREQLLRALRNQKVVGGRLGTCLLEIDALAEEALLRALAAQQGVDFAAADDLRGIPDEVIDTIPAKVARAHHALPFYACGTHVNVAMIDARDLRALDELAFVTGRRVVPYVTSEVRLVEALEKYYGDECPPRFAKLIDRMNRARFLWQPREEAKPQEMLQWDASLGVRPQTGPAAAAAKRARAAATTIADVAPPAAQPRVPPPAARPRPRPSAPIPPTLPVPIPPIPAAPRPSQRQRPDAAREPSASTVGMDLGESERRLLDPEDAEHVARVLVEFLASRTRLCALFKVRKSEVAGWLGAGVDADRLADYRLRLDRPSMFVALNEGAPLHRGPLPDLVAHVGLRGLLGDAAGGDLAALPLHVRDRLVGVLVAAPHSSSFDAELFSALQRIAAKASIALDLLILRKKLRKA